MNENKSPILDPTSFSAKYVKKKKSGELYYTKKEMKYFSETYCKIPYSIVDKSILKSKMIELYNQFSSFDKVGLPIFEYVNNTKTVELYY